MKSKSRIDKTIYNFFIDECNNKYWLKNELRHREKDLPAVIWNDGSMFWHKNGMYHRENDKPAIIFHDGTMAWFENGELIKRN